MDRKAAVFKLLKDHQADLKSIGVRNIGLFGSVLRGDDSEMSDYDFLAEIMTSSRSRDLVHT